MQTQFLTEKELLTTTGLYKITDKNGCQMDFTLCIEHARCLSSEFTVEEVERLPAVCQYRSDAFAEGCILRNFLKRS